MNWINAVAGAVGTALGAIGTVRNKAQDYWLLKRARRSRLQEVLSDLRVQQAIDEAKAAEAQSQGWPTADEVREAIERAERNRGGRQ